MVRIPLVTMTTDFGRADSYVATMKGVILSVAPDAWLADVSHEIGPQITRQAAYVPYSAYPFFPPWSVHLGVVDPGLGSSRRPVAARSPTVTSLEWITVFFSLVMA